MTASETGTAAEERTLTNEQQGVMNLVPHDGSNISNHALLAATGWTSQGHYFKVRNQLLAMGALEKGPGRGGSVRRPAPAELGSATHALKMIDGAALLPHFTDLNYPTESTLYTPIAAVLRGTWADERGTQPSVYVTAHAGAKKTGGAWSCPDITSVEIRDFDYLPSRYLEVMTFEVKPVWAINTQGVYEALAHRRAATHAHLILHIPDIAGEFFDEVVEDIATTALEHGIGLIVAADPADFSTWTVKQTAQRHEPDPERLSRFIGVQLPPEAKEKLS